MTVPAPNPLFRWLQISDLHVFDCAEANLMTWDFQNLSKNFHPDFLVVTGDFRSLNDKSKTSFEKTLSYLNAVVDQLGLDKKDVFLVPGNHDVYDYDCREAAITTICDKIDGDSNFYQKYYGKSMLDLMDGFSEYHKFVKDFYGDSLTPDDPRIATPAKVFSLPWRSCLNLIFVNTALVSDGKDHDQLCDIKGLTELNIQNNYPCIILAHHSPDRLFPRHQGLLPDVCKNFHVRAWLSGDAHRYDKKGIDRVDVPNLQTPVFVCGKTAIQTDDNYSAFGAIGYTCHDDGKVSVQEFSYEREAENKPYRFVPSPKFDLGINQPYTFLLYDTAPNPPLPSAKEVHNPGASLTETDKEDFSYCTPDWDLVGRDQEKQEILQLFSRPTAQICWVTGVAGIGKTVLCNAVCKELREKTPDRTVLRVAVAGVKNHPAFLETFAKALGISLPDQPDQWEKALLTALRDRKGTHTPMTLPVVYFDNFGDTWDFSEAEISHLNQLLLQIRALGYHLLFSSQRVSTAHKLRGKIVVLQPLAYDGQIKTKEDLLNMDSAKLFCSVWEQVPGSEKEWTIFRTLIRELSGHPLAIVLTANMARDHFGGLEAVAEQWHTATAEAEHPDDRHISLKSALPLLWNRLQEHKGAVQFWALQSHSILPIPRSMLKDLQGELSEKEWKDGMQKLWEYQLISKEDNAISMLPPIKKQFPLLGNTAQAQEEALLLWAKSLLQLLERANDWSKRESYYEAHYRVIHLLPQILYIIEELGNKEEHFSLFDTLFYATRNYYQYYLPSIGTLSRLLDRPYLNSHPTTFANISQYTADLKCHLGQLGEAESLYMKALPLYEKEQNDLGRANTLQSLGDLKRRLGQLEDAEKLYKDALPLFEKVQDDLGRANTLQSLGDLKRRLGQLGEAGSLYKEALPLYEKEQNDLGRANTLQSLGDLKCRLGQFKEAESLYMKALSLFEKEQNDLGRANTLKSLGDLKRRLGQLGEAESLYQEALPLYEKEQDDLGRANTLISMADLLIRRKKAPEALPLCKEAEALYIKEQEPLGQANIALSFAEAYRLTKEPDLAREQATKALEISEGIQYETGVMLAKLLLAQLS